MGDSDPELNKTSDYELDFDQNDSITDDILANRNNIGSIEQDRKFTDLIQKMI